MRGVPRTVGAATPRSHGIARKPPLLLGPIPRPPPHAGAVLGLAILGFSTCYSGIGGQVGAAVAVALPVRNTRGCLCLQQPQRTPLLAAASHVLQGGTQQAAQRQSVAVPSRPGTQTPAPMHAQLVSLWANGLGAFLTLMADRFKCAGGARSGSRTWARVCAGCPEARGPTVHGRPAPQRATCLRPVPPCHACRFDPAVTSVPLMTTIIDSTVSVHEVAACHPAGYGHPSAPPWKEPA